MPNIDSSRVWAMELHIADLDDRIRSLEADGATDAAKVRRITRLRVERNAEIRRRDLCILALLGADYVFTPGFNEQWQRMLASGEPKEPTPKDASYEEVRRRRRA